MQEQMKKQQENEGVKSQVQTKNALDNSFSLKSDYSEISNDEKEKKSIKNLKQEPKVKKEKAKEFKPSDLDDLRHKLDKKENAFLQKMITKRFTKNVSHAILIKRLVRMSLVLILLVITVVYIVSYAYVSAAGTGINIIADRTNTKSISLSEDTSFNNIGLSLKAEGIDALDNITFDWLPAGLNLSTGGSHNGENYIAYTFFVVNSGREDLTYESVLEIKHATKEVETAIRVRVFKNGSSTIYTHRYESENLIGDEGIDSFLETKRGQRIVEFTSPTVISYTQNDLAVSKYDKYTVVIWLEGEDVDCVNDKHSGELSLAWRFSVLDDN